MSPAPAPAIRAALACALAAAALAACGEGAPGASAEPDAIPLEGQTSAEADTAAHPGQAPYDLHCAQCHNFPEQTRSPSLESIRGMNAERVRYALVSGYMQQQARGVAPGDLDALIDFLTDAEAVDDGWVEAARCEGARAEVDLSMPATAPGWGFGHRNHRRMTAEQAGLTTADMERLELAWAIGFPQTPTMRAQPVIVGSTLFIAATDAARLYALDTETGCVKWVYRSQTPLRSSLSYGASSGDGRGSVLVFGDADGHVHAVDGATGALDWIVDVKLTPQNRVTGAPVVHEDRVFVPLSSIEVNYAPVDDYECCRSQGAVVALDLATGERLWTARTMEDATPRGVNRAGARTWGPSGAIIWNTPAIDVERNALYVGTGENTSLPATETSDAILSIDLDDGSINWAFQATADDVWNAACGRGGANCAFGEASVTRDVDFGASPMLVTTSEGRDLVVAGQKSSDVWALDADTGELVWRAGFGLGTALGGIHHGMAFDGRRVFAPLNDPYAPDDPSWRGPGVHALDVDTGEVAWSFDAAPECEGRDPRAARCATRFGLSAAVLVVDGALVTGSTDGLLRIFDAATGRLLFRFDTVRDFETVNGAPGRGGAIDNAAFTAADGTLFVASGYGRFGQAPGNVLLAFRPARER